MERPECGVGGGGRTDAGSIRVRVHDRFRGLRAWSSRNVVPLLLAFGALCRLAEYLQARLAWLDELSLAGNILGLSPGELFGPLGPPRAEIRVGAEPAGDLQARAEPVRRVLLLPLLRFVEEVAHDLHEALLGHHVGHPEGVVLGQSEEERLLVAEVVEDGAAGESRRLFETAYGGTFVAVTRETGTRAVEDLTAAGVEVVLTHPGHR